MSRYQPLADFLAAKKGDVWEASFSEIEGLLGFPLPQSAYKHPAWWANQSGEGHSQTRGWLSAGWRTCALDRERRRIRFERSTRSSPNVNSQKGEENESLFGEAARLTGISDRERLMKEALQALLEREAVRHLIAMGGAAPDYRAAPRDRPAG
ncbi:MAG: type II toxin-antitoxin system VapB family antitoxin [Pseudomonadota bacterium]|nr:type II toxin-antitoxin system VapB family antitoxin [Pseudomonadota bacterium]